MWDTFLGLEKVLELRITQPVVVLCNSTLESESFSDSLSLSPAHSQRLVNVKSRLKQAPRYPSLDRELIEYQERQLFEYFVVVSLHKKQAGAAYVPELTQQFPLKVQGGLGLCSLPGDYYGILAKILVELVVSGRCGSLRKA